MQFPVRLLPQPVAGAPLADRSPTRSVRNGHSRLPAAAQGVDRRSRRNRRRADPAPRTDRLSGKSQRTRIPDQARYQRDEYGTIVRPDRHGTGRLRGHGYQNDPRPRTLRENLSGRHRPPDGQRATVDRPAARQRDRLPVPHDADSGRPRRRRPGRTFGPIRRDPLVFQQFRHTSGILSDYPPER